MSFGTGPLRIIGAGPTGALLAILLRRRGLDVELYESRGDPRASAGESGRSINLALADRGIHALKSIGVFDALEATLVPMRGRLIHPLQGPAALQRYGQRPAEVIHSVSRHRLNQLLLDVAVRRFAVPVHFHHRFESADFARGVAQLRDRSTDRLLEVPMQPMLATDGAGSAIRRSMAAHGLIAADEVGLDHGYKELTIPAGPGGSYRMERDALHIWPRGNYMMIALPNDDGSFTATLFLSNLGSPGFETLQAPAAIEAFLAHNFPDVRPLMPDCVAEFRSHPTGSLGTVHCRPWHVRGMAALVGDAAHAIVPFHGQGMNCCFEDCVEFDALMDAHTSWESLFDAFGAVRKPNTDAIAAMALENYLEMRERVADPQFQLQQALALELERRHPERFIPRYAMVMFHHEIPYRTAELRGAVQTQLLGELTRGKSTLEQIDFQRAARDITTLLAPLVPADRA